MNLISISIKLYFLWLFKFSTQRKPHDSNHHSLDLVGATVYNLYDLYRRVLLLKCWSGDRWRVEGQFEEPGSSRTRNSFSSCHERMWGRADTCHGAGLVLDQVPGHQILISVNCCDNWTTDIPQLRRIPLGHQSVISPTHCHLHLPSAEI